MPTHPTNFEGRKGGGSGGTSEKEKESALIYFKDKLVTSSNVENFIKKIR